MELPMASARWGDWRCCKVISPRHSRLLHEAVTIATTFNLRVMQCDWQPLLGIVTLYGGDAPEARRLLSESLHLCLELKNKFFLARVCTYLAETSLVGRGARRRPSTGWRKAWPISADPQPDHHFQVARLLVAARLATAQQQYLRAATLFGLADQAAQPDPLCDWLPAGTARPTSGRWQRRAPSLATEPSRWLGRPGRR